jgi:DNA polymerase V
VVPAQAGLERQRRGWATKFEMRTPRYTTRVDELPTVHA